MSYQIRDNPVKKENPNIIDPRMRWLKRNIVETAKVSRVCLLGKDESNLEGVSMSTLPSINGRGLK